jgi:predicted porin
MHMQKKLIAVAVAGLLATPVAAEVAVSGSVRVRMDYDGNQWQVKNSGSRLRFKASSDLGNGQSAYMNYEFGVDAGKGTIQTGTTKRLTYVGLKGDWGSLSLGSQWSTLFNTVGTFIDPSNVYGGLGYWGNGGGQYRMPYSIALTTNLGGISVAADAQMSDGGDDLDRATIGTNLSVGAVSMGAAWQDNGDSDFTGIGASMNLAGMALSGGFTDVQNTGSGFGINGKLAGVTVAYEESDSVEDPTIWGNYKIGLGGGTSVRIELANDGTDTMGVGILRMDF